MVLGETDVVTAGLLLVVTCLLQLVCVTCRYLSVTAALKAPDRPALPPLTSVSSEGALGVPPISPQGGVYGKGFRPPDFGSLPLVRLLYRH